MSSAPRRRPPGSRTTSRRKPVGGRSTSAAAAIRRSASSRPGRLGERAGEPVGHGRRAPHRRALDDDGEQHQPAVAVGVDDPLARRALPALDRAREQRARRDRAVGVGMQPARREPVEHARGEHLHRRAQPVVAALPRHRAVHVGARERLAPPEAAQREPRERRRRRAVLARSPARSGGAWRCRGRRRSCARSRGGPRPASCSATIGGPSPATAAATPATSAARATSARSRNGARCSEASRSTSSSTPTSRRRASSTGRWRIPWSSISSSASEPRRSARDRARRRAHHVGERRVERRALGEHPRAQVAVRDDARAARRGRRARTSRPGATIARAASWTGVPGGKTQRRGADQLGDAALGGRLRRGGPAGASSGSDSARARKRAAAGRSSTGRMVAAGMR